MPPVEFERQLSFFETPGGHHCIEISHCGRVWRAYCACGWMSHLVPERWRAVRMHETHAKDKREWHDLATTGERQWRPHRIVDTEAL